MIFVKLLAIQLSIRLVRRGGGRYGSANLGSASAWQRVWETLSRAPFRELRSADAVCTLTSVGALSNPWFAMHRTAPVLLAG